MPNMKNILKNYPLPILLISLIFLIKALFLSFFITPFSAVPDEIGHFAYTQDIAYGKGIPVLSVPAIGKSVIGTDVMGYLERTPDSQPAYNWIAQHPPVYYAISAIPLKIGRWVSTDMDVLVRLPRISSALSGALLLLVLFRTFTAIGLDPPRSTALAAAIGFIPMVSHLSSGTNHDMSLFLFCALATLFFSYYIINRKIKDAYRCAIWLAIAGGTKMMTPLVLLVPMVLILILELPRENRLKHAIKILIIAFSIPAAWMIRNFVYFQFPLYTSGTHRKPGLEIPLQQSFSDYIRSQPVFDSIAHLFYGMFGHITPSSEKIFLEYDVLPRPLKFISITASGVPYDIFLGILFALSCIGLIYIWMLLLHVSRENPAPLNDNSFIALANFHLKNYRYRSVPLMAAYFMASAAAIFINITSFTDSTFILFSCIPISIFLGIISIPLIFYIKDRVDRLALYGLAVTLFFGSVFLHHIYDAYLTEGVLRAAQGRYFYPAIPLVILSASIILLRLHIPKIVINIGITLLACAELSVYVKQALPFYLKYYS
ncbi:glycosyltransferase family 39 protein [Collimonas fungivorans]|uniref:Glycosyltransferase RgtA/B/C/D-like domain-containing protein n=1 Tax=Collimonas fungivorans (strain Ter331) TaxID=1005048 RepID=G0AI77_COLFT|nr:glycosyltransferase family 39 protein [Collimonas fungivorans]AEK60660.1 hypothetical protein CFU_0826 [Collimonas fungivorans Ter331]